jgi:hypothetical protein
MTSESGDLVDRVAVLERENGRLKWIGGIACVLIASFIFASAAKHPQTISAEKIILLDTHGRARLTISTPAVAGVAIDIAPDDPAVWFSDEKGADRAVISTDGLFFANAKSRPTVSLSNGDAPGASSLRFYQPDGKISWSAP